MTGHEAEIQRLRKTLAAMQKNMEVILRRDRPDTYPELVRQYAQDLMLVKHTLHAARKALEGRDA